MRAKMIRNLAVLLSLLVVMFATELRAAEKEETFEPGTGKYLLVLIDPHTEVIDKKTGKKAKEPDVAKHGGKVLSKNDRARVIKLPVAAAKAMRKEENVAYMQRIWLGESLENWDPQDATAPSALSDTDLDSVEEEDNLTWSTGQFLYDGSGNIKQVGNDTYSYDSAGRLSKSVVNGTTETYKYDSFGNLTEKTIGNAVGQVPVDSSSNRLRGETYDAAGNMITHKGADRFSFDSLNMMDEVEVAFGSTRRMLYGPDEERIGIIHDENLIRWTLRDFDGRVLREYRGDCCVWEWLEDYVYGEGRLLAGERVPFFRGKRHFHTDHLGTIRLITDQNTRLISRHDFFPFGVEQTDAHYERKGSTLADDYRARTEPMKYTTHEREFLGWYNTENTDYLDHMHARTYDPNMGRFSSVDPIVGTPQRPQSWNRYSYVENNPVSAIDPTGMKTDCVAKDDGYVCTVTPDDRFADSVSLLKNWVLERGEEQLTYNQNDYRSLQMRRTRGVEAIRQAYKDRGCTSSIVQEDTLYPESEGTMDAAIETFFDANYLFNPTQAQVGGFSARVDNLGDGRTMYTVANALTVNSFFYHIPNYFGLRSLGEKSRGGAVPLMGRVKQKFRWTEKTPEYCP